MCRPHIVGVDPRLPPFFVPGCSKCEAKKLAGKVTGNEPPPPDRHLAHGKPMGHYRRREWAP